MLGLPQTTYFGKLIPKTKFYDKLTIDKKVERSFIDQIASVRWVHKLSADTLNVSKGNTVDEIEVFLIKLKTPELDINVLKQMDRQLPYHLIFRSNVRFCSSSTLEKFRSEWCSQMG